MTRRYDESLSAIQEMQQAGTAVYKVEDMEFGRRLAVERELELPGPDGKSARSLDITRSKGYDIGPRVPVPLPRLQLGTLLLKRLKY